MRSRKIYWVLTQNFRGGVHYSGLFSIYDWGVNKKLIRDALNFFGDWGMQNIVGKLEQHFGELLRRECYKECIASGRKIAKSSPLDVANEAAIRLSF